VPKSIGLKTKSTTNSKGVGILREIASVKKKIVQDIINDYEDEGNKNLLQLVAQNAKLAFQGYAYAEDVKVNLTNDLDVQLEQMKQVDKEKIRCTVKQEPIVTYMALNDDEVKRREGLVLKLRQ